MPKQTTNRNGAARFEEIPEFAAPPSEANYVTVEQIKTYEEMIKYFSSGRALRSAPPPPFFYNEAAPINMYKSFSSAVVTPFAMRQRDQWNPITQRPVVAKFEIVKEHLSNGFDDVASFVNAYIMLHHEMVHTVTWEPFLTGYYNPKEAGEFMDFSLQSEAYAFFETDMVLTPTIRGRYPDAEILFQTLHYSLLQFHPYRAFKAAGITRLRDILEVYLDGLMGKGTALEGKKGNFLDVMKTRIKVFYEEGALPALPYMHQVLSMIGIFDEFFERFCAKPGLPSLFSKSLLETAQPGKSRSYYLRLFEQGAGELAALDEAQIERVRMRRSIQSRAYYALELTAIVDDELYTPQIDGKDQESLSKNIARYSDDLEKALGNLAAGSDCKSVAAAVEAADRNFDKEVRTFFESKKMWVGQRMEIQPVKRVKRFSVSLDMSKPKTAAEIVEACVILQREMLDALKTKSGAEKAAALHLIMRFASIAETLNGDPGNTKACREFLELLRMERVLPLWSVPLWKIDPLNNKFEELLFNYE